MTDRYVSLFSGAGSLDLGLARAGYAPGLLVDRGRFVCETLRAAGYGDRVVQADVHDLLNNGAFASAGPAWRKDLRLVAGSPPLLKSGSTGPVSPFGDEPQLLYRFLDAVGQLRPAAFVMAVPPLLSGSRWYRVRGRLRAAIKELGYDSFMPVLDAADYGVASKRTRMLVIGMPPGCKPDDSAAPRAPARVTAGTALRGYYANSTRVRDVPCMAGVTLLDDPVLRNSPYSGQLLAGTGRVIDLRKVAPGLPAALGGNKTPVIDLGQLEDDSCVPWIEEYHDRLWRLYGSPGGPVPDGARMRRLSLRECAVLNGLPGAHPFRGPEAEQFSQAGSAVPPALGEAAGRAIAAGLA